jgi:NAD(P)-dependent dehydrogenase (short-subunit alcohol dehydrogenase family)
MEQTGSDRRTPVRRGAGALAGIAAALGIDRFKFQDQVVIVTGGSRGLGFALTRRLARMGARVAMLARDEAVLERARDNLQRRGLTALAVRCDVRDPAQIEAAVATVTRELGPVTMLINNAGIIQVGPMETMTPEDYEDAMRTHFWGPLHMTLAVLPGMRERGSGRIVNIASIGGKITPPHLLPYDASKFALVGLSEGMRAELAKDGIRVTTVCPGLMRTGSVYNAFFKGRHREEFTWFAIGASLPILSISAERAVSQILRAARRGRAEIMPSRLAALAARVHGLSPRLTAAVFGLVNRILPGPGGIGTRRVRGRDSQTALTSSFLTTLSQRAALEYNQIAETDRRGAAPPRRAEPG